MQHQKATGKRYEQMQLADQYPEFSRIGTGHQGMAPRQETKNEERVGQKGLGRDAGGTGQ